MRLLIITAVFPPEPIVSAKISKDLARQWSEKGYDVTVLAPNPSRPEGFNFSEFYNYTAKDYFNLELPDVKIVRLNSFVAPSLNFFSRLRENYSFGKQASMYITDNFQNFDCVYVNSWPLFSQYLIAKAAIRTKIPYIIHIQDIYPESLENKLPTILKRIVNKLLMPIEIFNLKNAKKIIAISPGMKTYLCATRNLFMDSVQIVYNWHDEADFLEIPCNNDHSKFTFMYLGNIGPVAGVEILIKAFGEANVSDTCLIIAGNGANKKKCEMIATQFPLSDIRFLKVPEGEVAKVQQLADVLLLPMKKGTSHTSIPSKLPAYMFSAKPILASIDSNSDTANVILKAECGWTIASEDIEMLKKSFQEITKIDTKVLRQKGKSGRSYALASFSKRKNLDRLSSIIEKW